METKNPTNQTVTALKATTENKVPLPERTIGNVVDMNGLSDSMRDSILRAYLGEPDPTQYGIVQAVTAAAKGIFCGGIKHEQQ